MTPSDFRLAIIGCGRWGFNHVRTAHTIFGAELKTVVDLVPAHLERVTELSGDIRLETRPDAVFEDPEITAVIIATSVESHFDLARRALDAGKHVLVEKPMALFSEQARELHESAEKKGLVLMVGHLLLFHPAIQAIKKMVDDGTLGRLQYIYSNRLNLGTVRKEENILWSFAPHDVSLLQYLIEADPLSVEASGGIYLQPGIHDVTLTSFDYPGNIKAHIHVSWLHPFKEHRLVVIGDKSMVVFEDTKKADKLVLYPKGIDWVKGEPIKRDGDFQVVPYGEAMPLQAEQEHFRTAVVEGTRPLTDGAHAVSVLAILEKAQAGLEGHRADVVETAPAASPAESMAAKLPYRVHPTAVVDDGCTIGAGTSIWHYSHVQGGTTIGEKCTLGQNVNVGNNVRIGSHCKIQNNVSVYEGVELEDYVFCGPSMVFTNIQIPRCEFPQRGSEFYIKTLVKRGASIGANATIVCGTTIGKYAFVGAGAVVTKDVPDHALVLGNPARVVGWMTRRGRKVASQEAAIAAEE